MSRTKSVKASLIKPELPSGFRDLSPAQFHQREKTLNTMKNWFSLYGFLPLSTPCVERYDVLHGKYGEEGERLIYNVLNSGEYHKKLKPEDLEKKAQEITPQISKRALRYDHTLPLARYISAHQHELKFPFRRYQIGPVWRADRTQKGRYKEFWQCDADIIYKPSTCPTWNLKLDKNFSAKRGKLSDHLLQLRGLGLKTYTADCLEIALHVFDDLRLLEDIKIEYNDRQDLIEKVVKPSAGKDYLKCLSILDSLDKRGHDEVRERLAEKGWLGPTMKALLDQGLKTIEHEELIVHNPLLARGLDYYTGLVYEIRRRNGGATLAAGGEYDNLTRYFSKDSLPGVGISFGVDRILEALGEEDYKGTAYILCHVQGPYQNYYDKLLKSIQQDERASFVLLQGRPLMERTSTSFLESEKFEEPTFHFPKHGHQIPYKLLIKDCAYEMYERDLERRTDILRESGTLSTDKDFKHLVEILISRVSYEIKKYRQDS
ncbi:MAG: HisS family protein [Cytophagales bacterium]|nr:HisS family protein [Cytophagales bacterium]